MLYSGCKELEMDYTEAELEARIFPSVDLDPLDWEDVIEEEFDDDEEFDFEDIEFAPTENLGIEAYAHWNEQAAQMWWLEEGRFG
jgi:hypothetical protein